MIKNHVIFEKFNYSTEAQLIKSKLDAEGIRTDLMDEKTIDTDPLLSQAIGGVKLTVHYEDLEKAKLVYNEIRVYEKNADGKAIHCPKCNGTRILVAEAQRQNFFYMLFPFFESRKFFCNECETVFK